MRGQADVTENCGRPVEFVTESSSPSDNYNLPTRTRKRASSCSELSACAGRHPTNIQRDRADSGESRRLKPCWTKGGRHRAVPIRL